LSLSLNPCLSLNACSSSIISRDKNDNQIVVFSIFNQIFGKDCKNLSKIQTKLNGHSFNILVLSLTSTKTHKFLDAIKNVCGIETEKKRNKERKNVF
jgi:hypothetical protein